MGPQAHLLPGGDRLHLQHGPIDLVIGADGQRSRAFEAAHARFGTVLAELVAELPRLREPLNDKSAKPHGIIAARMHAAVAPFVSIGHLTRMAAVAGAVADEVLHAMVDAARLERAYVNNGGDIALHLAEGQVFRMAISDHTGRVLGQIALTRGDGIAGIATSGRHGRSHSLGIADSATVLARSAAAADAAATLIANAVDLPGHPGVNRCPAHMLDDNTDLGAQPVVTHCAPLSHADCRTALQSGLARAASFKKDRRIEAAALFLQNHSAVTGRTLSALQLQPKEAEHA
ncbi:Thiamine biosynthesis protein ApbE [Candidatus Rhodobacter oscarellae]|uniref:Thiamine biosynthesis protein ApbE n=1 Tax=Candidatus Rhodobacter oscarellae TaxID=1675527 RepID=A0A0J9H366_9RHOB|nr:UPF0280 family protein [Candidatus Rhodobacter lobularis]KMW60103.1 Thiamine biosynthesis protein ApbE [Candidatus Rhodobacter lobularis]